ncbi:MAG: hypothetical protein P4L46_23935 [Fimbriimonas sp.]|nr:hypothetical protein [Fimbriimonas sp.]
MPQFHSTIPTHAERTIVNGEPAWVWTINAGWTVLQGPYLVSVENWRRESGQDWHSFRYDNVSPRTGGPIFGGFEGNEGHIDRSTFLEIAAKVIQDLRTKDAPPTPPDHDA